MLEKGERWFMSYMPTSMAGSCYDSLLPIFIVMVLGGDVGDVALVSLFAAVSTVPLLVMWGYATDSSKNRKMFVIIGYLGRAAAYIIMAASAGLPGLAAAHVVLGVLGSASAPAFSILILEHFTKDKWCEKIGLFNKVAGVGNILGLLMGIAWITYMPGVLGFEGAVRILFLTGAGLAIVGAWMAHLLIEEPAWKLNRTRLLDPVMELARWTKEKIKYLPGRMSQFFRPSHLTTLERTHSRKGNPAARYLVSTFIYNSGMNSFYCIMPVWIIASLGFSGNMLFLLSLVLMSVSTFAYKPIGKLLDQGDKSRALFSAVLLRAVLVTVCAFSLAFASVSRGTLFALLVVAYMVLGFTWAVIADTQLPIFSGIKPDKSQGAKAGVFNAVVGLGHIAGDAAGGILVLAIGFSNALLATAALLALSAGIYLSVKAQPAHDSACSVGDTLDA